MGLIIVFNTKHEVTEDNLGDLALRLEILMESEDDKLVRFINLQPLSDGSDKVSSLIPKCGFALYAMFSPSMLTSSMKVTDAIIVTDYTTKCKSVYYDLLGIGVLPAKIRFFMLDKPLEEDNTDIETPPSILEGEVVAINGEPVV